MAVYHTFCWCPKTVIEYTLAYIVRTNMYGLDLTKGQKDLKCVAMSFRCVLWVVSKLVLSSASLQNLVSLVAAAASNNRLLAEVALLLLLVYHGPSSRSAILLHPVVC